MSATPQLSPLLQTRLAAVSRRIRLLALTQGLSELVLALTLVGGVALLADYWLELPAWIRRAWFTAWLGIGATAILISILRPLLRRHRPEDLAAAVEAAYPELDERLYSTVELARGPGHGSPALIAMLERETEAKSSAVDFSSSISGRRVTGLGLAAGLVLALALVPAILAPGVFGDRFNRFFFSYSTWVDAPYTFAITPGDTVAAVGRTLTFSVQIQPRNERVELPTACTLVVTDATGHEARQRMTADRSDHFSLAYTVRGDIRYRIEAGPAASETFQVTGVVPVELAAESPTLVVTPPAYAQTAFDVETYHGLMDLSALKQSQVHCDFRFTRPLPDLPGAAYLEWTTSEVREGKEGTQASSRTTRLPLVVAEERRAATLQMVASATGSYRVVLMAEHGIRTELDGGTLTVKDDEPPQVVQYSGRDNLKSVPHHERLPLEVTLVDDVAVAGAELEYSINGGPIQREVVSLEGRNTREARGRHVFALAGKVKEGDEVRYRLRAWDNLPEPLGGPHVIYHPADKWLTLAIARDALPLKEQEILAQRDHVNRRLEDIKADLLKEQRGAYKLRQESKGEQALNPEQVQDLKQLQGDNQASENALRELAREVAGAPELQPLSERARSVANREMRQTEASLRQTGEKKTTPEAREEQLQKADTQLESALERLGQLQRDNERIARDRLDQAKVEALGEREKDLAERAAELARKDPERDASAKEQLEQVRREQDEVAAELQKLAEQSELLRQALEAARAEQARNLAERARELAQAQRELEQAQTEGERQRNAEQLAELARKQQELAEKAERLAQETRQPAVAARVASLQPEAERRAAAALRLGDAEDALKHQTQAARELERLANDLDRAQEQARDPREAAKQLARLQEALLQRTSRALQEKNNDERREELKKEQRALQQAIDQLSVPLNNTAAERARREAAEKAGKAADELARKEPDARVLRSNMEETRRRLERLADELAPLEQRRQQAQQAVTQLRRQQEALAKQIEKAELEAKKDDPKSRDQLAKKLAEAARKQAELAEALSRLDAPNQEAQQQQAQESLNRALADLMDARRPNLSASQQEAQRQLEQLEKSLQSKKSEDEPTRTLTRQNEREKNQAEPSPQELARQAAQEQRELAKATKEAQDQAEKPSGEAGKKALEKALEDLARRQEELNQRVSQLPANQMQRSLEQARALMNQAQQALARQDANEARQNQSEAARALERLAQRLPEKPVTTAGQQPSENNPPQGLPNKQQSEQARQLAKEQRELGNAVRQALESTRAEETPAKENPLGDLAREQGDVAKQAAELARQIAKEDGAKSAQARQAQQAGQITKQAAERMQAGALQEAQPAGQQAAEQLRELTRQLAQTPRGNADPKAPDTLQTARQLTRKQEELNRRLGEAARDPNSARTQQAARQQELERQAGDLTQELNRLAQQMQPTPPAQQAAQQAGQASQQAQAAMRQAQQQSRQGSQAQARQAQQQAAQALDRAAQRADQAGARQAASRQETPPQSSPQAGQALQQAQGQMAQAQGQMAQGQPQGAQAAMQQAAQSLQQAAQQMAPGGQQQPGQPTPMGPPGEHGIAPGGPIDETILGPELKQYAGKSWGELPGELRTKIVQDMRAKYGEDYARLIKLYFEQMATTNRPTK